MQAFIQAKHEEIAEICRMHHVRRLSLFGSAARDDFDQSRSDVDLLVDFDYPGIEGYADNRHSLEESLTRLFRRQIDLITDKYVRNSYLRKEIDADKELLYAA